MIKKIFKNTILNICLLSVLFCSFIPSKVFGVDYGFYAANDILYYDPNACNSGSGDGNLIGNDNIEKGLRFFVGKGLSLAQAAGIVANYKWESGGFDPRKIEGGEIADDSYTMVAGVGFGIGQWTSGGRQQGLTDYAKSKGKPITDLQTQLEWGYIEMQDEYYVDSFNSYKNITSPYDAAIDFEDWFEKSADTPEEVIENRAAPAQKIYDEYKGVIADGKSTTSSTSSTASCNAESGKASNFIDGFAIYDQYDPQWADKPYGGSATIAESGCGPSAMAMIITALTGKTVTPLDTATYGAENGTTAGDGADGSKWNIQTVIGEHWGLKSENIEASVNAINTALQGGALIITSGSGSAPFTSGGHYIVIRAVTKDGKWLIGDSNGSKGAENSKTEWDPETILNGIAESNVWAVTK